MYKLGLDELVGIIPETHDATGLFEIFPLPAADGFVHASYSMTQAARVLFSVYDMNGKAIRRLEVQAAAGLNTATLSLESVPAGIFLLEMQHNGQSVSKKIIIQ